MIPTVPGGLKFVWSQKGKCQLAQDGYFYVREKVVHDKVYWRCVDYTSKKRCHARIHTSGDQIVRNTPHCHDPCQTKNIVYVGIDDSDQKQVAITTD